MYIKSIYKVKLKGILIKDARIISINMWGLNVELEYYFLIRKFHAGVAFLVGVYL